LVAIWTVIVATLFGFVWRRRVRNDRRIIGILLSAVAINLTVFAIVWAADAYEIGHHEIVPTILLRYLLWVGTFFAVDRLSPRWSSTAHTVARILKLSPAA
jgi:hypothetical protein